MTIRNVCLLMSVAANLAPAAPTPGTVLIQDGRTLCPIVVPNQANETIRFAADELVRYLQRISGATVPVIEERRFRGQVRIDVGPTTRSRSVMPKKLKADSETVVIRSDAKGLVICGESDRATLYGVYRFLEEMLGCRWLAPAGHEYVPTRKTVSATKASYETTPKFELRAFICGDDADRMNWGLKVGLNGFYTAAAAKTNGGCYYLPEEIPGCHTWYRVIPESKYFEQHPAWFPLLGGKRVPGKLHNAQLCVTAEGLADEFAANIINIFDGDPGCRITSISPNDGYGWCDCERCLALDEKLCGNRTTKQGLAKERPFRGDRVFWFANEVARRVAEKHPDKILLVLAYVNYAEPPDTVRPLPNVVPWLCHYAPADYSRPIADPSSGPNRQFNTLLRSWATVAPHLLFYAYVSKSMWWELPRPVTRSFAADVKYLDSLGIHRYYAQSGMSGWALDGPLYYVLAKLLWDPTLDADEVAQDWIEHMFGQAAPQMTRFYQAVEDAVHKTGKSYSDNPPRDVPGLYVIGDLDRAAGALSKAAEAADDAAVKDRIAQVTAKFMYGYYMVQAIEAVERFKQEGDLTARRKAEEYGKRALALQKVPKAVLLVESMRVFSELGVVGKGFGQVEELGGRRCWNSDETGVGDGRAGWASFFIEVADPTHPVKLEMDVWGKSQLNAIVIHSDRDAWNRIAPPSRLSGQAKWETLVYEISPELMMPRKKAQEIGFGGGDSQVWVARIRVVP